MGQEPTVPFCLKSGPVLQSSPSVGPKPMSPPLRAKYPFIWVGMEGLLRAYQSSRRFELCQRSPYNARRWSPRTSAPANEKAPLVRCDIIAVACEEDFFGKTPQSVSWIPGWCRVAPRSGLVPNNVSIKFLSTGERRHLVKCGNGFSRRASGWLLVGTVTHHTARATGPLVPAQYENTNVLVS